MGGGWAEVCKEEMYMYGAGTKFLITKFLITKVLTKKFLMTKFLSNKVPNTLNSQCTEFLITKFLIIKNSQSYKNIYIAYNVFTIFSGNIYCRI